MEQKEQMEQRGPESQIRKPFHAPRLLVYGNISTITKHGGTPSAHPDNPGHHRTAG